MLELKNNQFLVGINCQTPFKTWFPETILIHTVHCCRFFDAKILILQNHLKEHMQGIPCCISCMSEHAVTQGWVGVLFSHRQQWVPTTSNWGNNIFHGYLVSSYPPCLETFRFIIYLFVEDVKVPIEMAMLGTPLLKQPLATLLFRTRTSWCHSRNLGKTPRRRLWRQVLPGEVYKFGSMYSGLNMEKPNFSQVYNHRTSVKMVKTLMISWHENLIFTLFGLQTVQYSSNQFSRSQIHESTRPWYESSLFRGGCGGSSGDSGDLQGGIPQMIPLVSP